MFLLVGLLVCVLQQVPTSFPVSGTVADENRLPVPGVQVTLRSATNTERTSTNELGQFRFETVSRGDYQFDFDKPDFFRLSNYDVRIDSAVELSIVLNHEYEMRSQVDVVAAPPQMDPQETQHTDELVAHEIREDPIPGSHVLQNALPALPGVVQDNSGSLHVAGARVEDTSYLLDGFTLNNPATGLFDARINVDAVRAVDVLTGRYGAQFENAASGVMAIQTNTGDDHWRLGATNFLPGFSLERGVHLGAWFPRWTFSGPLQKGRAWFSDGLSLQHSFALVRELPPGGDITQTWSGDNLFKGQYNLTPRQSILGNFLYNTSKSSRSGLGPFAPASTTSDLHSRRYLVSLQDQISLRDGVLDVGAASDSDHLNRLPQGSETYLLTPEGPRGNYFERLVQNSHRWQARTNLALAGKEWRGEHDLQLGVVGDVSSLHQTADRHAVELRGASSVLKRHSFFSGNPSLTLSEAHTGAYAQDAWHLRSWVILQSAFRIDRNDFASKTLVQPRFAVNWFPRKNVTKITTAWGIYYQPIYLSLIAPLRDQSRFDVLYGNPYNDSPTSSGLISFAAPASRRQPYFDTASVEWAEQWGARTTSAVHVLRRMQHSGLVYENVSTGGFNHQMFLTNNRRDRYQAVDISLRRSTGEGEEVMVDYTYSRSRSNKIFDFSADEFLLADQAAGPLTWDAPHRVISRGAHQTKLWNLFLSYFVEYHTGFPFSANDSFYQLSGLPNGYRYPSYFSVNVGVEKRFYFYRYQWAGRVSVINVTAHHNYTSVINNVDASNFLTFAGGQRRAFTGRLRLVGRK